MLNNNENFSTVRNAEQKAQSDVKRFQKKNNVIPKILCVIAAFFLWLYVMQTESPEYEDVISSVTVEIENSSELQSQGGLSVYSRSGNIVNVKLTGKKSVIAKLNKDDLHAYIDVGKIKESGQHALNVFVDLPDGIERVEAEPSTITVYVDSTDTVSLPVSEKMENLELVTPYELGEVRFEYDSITVTGPKNKLKQLAGAQVSVNMKDKTTSFTARCPIDLIDSSGKRVDMSYLITSASEMNVTVPIYVTKEVPVQTIFKYGFLNDETAKVTVTPETVTVKGDETKFTDIQAVLSPVVIDEKLITENVYTMTLRAQSSSDVVIAEDDLEIKVNVVLDDSIKTKQFTTSDIVVKGAPANLNYEVLTEEVTVTLRGTADVLSEITTADISLTVDLSGYDPAANITVDKADKTATVVVDSEYSSKVYEVGTYTVQIKIN